MLRLNLATDPAVIALWFILPVSQIAGAVLPASDSQDVTDLQIKPRLVRVLIAADVRRLRLDADGPVSVRDNNGQPLNQLPALHGVVVEAQGSVLRIGSRTCDAAEVLLTPERASLRAAVEQGDAWSAGLEYPGALRVAMNKAGTLDAINLVDIEEYVAAVVANEVWPTFDQEALRAQAVVSRTFVLYQMNRRPAGEVDLTATQSSQVYRGLRRDEVGRLAKEAAEFTRGIVLTYRDEGGVPRLFCTYYSAACGGSSQSAALLGPEGDVPPLRGGVACDYCRIAPGDAYRWGPVALETTEVLSRLRGRFAELSDVTSIRAIEAVQTTNSGRPVTWRVIGAAGEQYDFLAERLRLAIDGGVIRSTDCRIRVADGRVIFENGKGYGHGLGLCQWGMQGQALEGRRAGQILTYYFPGASLTRVY